jgi:hypothetical protein
MRLKHSIRTERCYCDWIRNKVNKKQFLTKTGRTDALLMQGTCEISNRLSRLLLFKGLALTVNEPGAGSAGG